MAKRSRSGKRTARTDAATARADGVVNRVSGHGTARDRRMFAQHELDFVNDLDALTIYRSDDLLQRAASARPFDAFRRGVGVRTADDGKENATLMAQEIDRLELIDKFRMAGALEAFAGGAAILPIYDRDSGSLATPLGDTPRVRKIVALHVLQPRELVPETWYADISSPRFRFPATYRFVPMSVIGIPTANTFTTVIHESRLIIFDGFRAVPHHVLGQRIGWGDSVFFRIRLPATDYQMAWGSTSTLLHDFSQGVYSFDGMHDMLKQKNGKQQMRDRVAFLDELRSTIRGMVIDGKDKFERKATPITGLADLLVQSAQRVAAAFEMPVTRLLGMSPAGLNATGEHDTRTWYDAVEVYRRSIDAKVRKALRLIFLQSDGPWKGEEPEQWSTEWPPLWQPTEKEIAETRLTVAQADKLYVVDIGAATAAQVARARFGGDEYSMEMHIDESDIDALDAAEKLAAQAPAPPPPADAGQQDTGGGAPEADPAAPPKPAPVVRARGDADDIADDISRELESDYPERALEWIRTIKWVGPVRVPVSEIDFTGEAKWRASHEPDKVDKFAKRIEDGSEKPLLLVRRPGQSKLMIVDGHHRALSYRAIGKAAPGGGALAYVGNAPSLAGPWDEFHASQRAKADKNAIRASAKPNGHDSHGWGSGWRNAPAYKPGDEG